MRYLLYISLFIGFIQTAQGQTAVKGKPGVDEMVNEENSVADSTIVEAGHPADSLYASIWNNFNITYTAAKIPAKQDTLLISMKIPGENSFVAPMKGKVISGYGTPRRPGHTGIDVKLHAGDTVRSILDGQVRLAKRFSGYGYLVLVRHSNGLETLYAHLSQLKVKEKQWVKAGELIGLGGRTGRATTEHLHFEARIFGETFDPARLINFETGALVCDSFYFHRSRMERNLADFKAKKDTPLLASGDITHYFIRKGDTLSSIARRFGTSIKALCSLNNISPQKVLKIGTKLIVHQHE